jgi:hypothetical protein
MTTGTGAKIITYFKNLHRRGGQIISVFGALALLIIISSFISPNFITAYNITIMSRDLG